MTGKGDARQSLLPQLLLDANRRRSAGDYGAALAAYLEILERAGESPHLCAVIAVCHLHMADDTREGAEHAHQSTIWMERAVALAPEDAHLHAYQGEQYMTMSVDYERSAFEYREALRLDPDDVSALVGLTALYGLPEEVVTLQEAIGCMERAIRLAPDETWYHGRLAEFYAEAGRGTDSDRDCLRALLCAQPLDLGYARFVMTRLADMPEPEELP